MTEREIYQAIAALEPIALNVVGFHDLSENVIGAPPLKQLEYDAQVYANGVQLAKMVCRIIREMDRERRS